MELAKVTSKEGDKILLVEDQGRVIMMNSSMEALWEAQTAFEAEAERLGIKDEQDVTDLIRDLRRERMED